MSKTGKYIYGIVPNVVTQGSITSGSRRDAEAETRFGINSPTVAGSCPSLSGDWRANSKNSFDTSASLSVNGESFDSAQDASKDAEPVEARSRTIDPCWILENEKVYPVSYQDVSAIVSESEIIDYTGLRKDILARQLVKHQKIIEGIMPEYSIIPLKLGTIALDDEVKEILANGYKLIKEIFSKISDKIELDVVAIWSDFNSMLKEVGEEKEIKEFKEQLLSNPKGITVDDQMKIGFMLKKALERKKDEYAQKILGVLKMVSLDFKSHELMDDKMVINTAFLIAEEKRVEFEQKIEELNALFLEKLNFRCVGPLPPYSFYTLEVKKLKFQEIDWARKKLGLINDTVTREDIKRAHQIKAFSYHPDKNPDILGIEKEFDEVSRAFKVLWEYCVSSEQAGQNEIFSFDERDFKKNSILVKVKE
jgi:hypothetical protein